MLTARGESSSSFGFPTQEILPQGRKMLLKLSMGSVTLAQNTLLLPGPEYVFRHVLNF